jgi:radical SAM protein with 4Fe4S-binding SPASM domain
MDWLSVRKAWEVVRKPDVCGQPYYVQFEVTTHCNLACYMCVRNEVIKHPRHLPLADFQRMFDQIEPRRLTLSGAGEPLLNPDLVAMIAHAGRHGASTMIPSNGTLLRKGELARRLVEAGLNTLKISIDAATAQTYQAIRRQDCFDQILDGIRQLEEIKRQRSRRTPELRFDVVILNENYAEIPDIVELARQLHIGTIFFRPLQVTGIGKEREAIGRDMDFDGLYRAVREGLARATRLGVRTNLKEVARDFGTYRSIYVRQDAAMDRQVCLLPWVQCFISVKGELAPCCATYTNESFSAGNVFEEGFEAVWNGPRMQTIRRQFRRRKNPFAVCRDCIPRSLPVLLKMSSMLPGFVWSRRARPTPRGTVKRPDNVPNP